VKVGVLGYGEGGLVAMDAAAVDPRIDACLVSGYFDSRQGSWKEPLYRNVWGFLAEFGDAEVASLIAPRGLVVEYGRAPEVSGPPKVRPGRRGGAAAGEVRTPAYDSVAGEFKRIETLLRPNFQPVRLVAGPGGTTDIFAWGILLLPKDLKAGENRPVYGCSYGGETAVRIPRQSRGALRGATAEAGRGPPPPGKEPTNSPADAAINQRGARCLTRPGVCAKSVEANHRTRANGSHRPVSGNDHRIIASAVPNWHGGAIWLP